MSDVRRFMAAGPWLTRELRECVQASDFDRLTAENKRLKDEADSWCAACEDWKETAGVRSDQRDRLAAALREIAKGKARDGGPADPAAFARAALAGTGS